MQLRPCTRVAAALAIAALFAATPARGQTQEVQSSTTQSTTPRIINTCYVPDVGLLYLILEPFTPPECLQKGNTQHIAFSWSDGLPGNDHGALNGLADDDHLQYLKVDPATRALIANLNAAGFKVVGLTPAAANGEAVVYEQAVKKADPAGGDLIGTYPNPAVNGLRGRRLSTIPPSSGQVLAWSGTEWAPATPSTGITDHGGLVGLTDDDHPQYLKVNPASRALITDLSAAGFKILNLRPAAAPGEAVVYEQALKTADPAGGDLVGPYPNPTVVRLHGRPVSSVAPATGQVLAWDGGQWAATTPASGVADHGALNGLSDDDHPLYLLANGVRPTTDGFAVTGTFGAGVIPAENAGVRMMWYPRKAAFRAGGVGGSFWNSSVIGDHSAAFGLNTVASGSGSAALGSNARAAGDGSFATGNGTEASGTASLAMGQSVRATAPSAVAMGINSIASAFASVAMGANTTAAGGGAVALGSDTNASGGTAVALGSGTTASGLGSVAAGFDTEATADYATAFGRNTTASGFGSVAMGTNTTASGDNSVAIGQSASTDDPGGIAHSGVFVFGDGTGGTKRPTASSQFVASAINGIRLFNFHGDSRFSFEQGSGTGCRLLGGNLTCTGAITSSSDVAVKTNFLPMDADDVLNRLSRIAIQSWSYRADDPAVRHVGPTAQDFRAAFGLGQDDRTISAIDADGINMLAIQALEKRTMDISARLAELEQMRADYARLQARHDLVRERLDRLEALLDSLLRTER